MTAAHGEPRAANPVTATAEPCREAPRTIPALETAASTAELAQPALSLECSPRWLVLRFAQPQRTASWAFLAGGLRPARSVAFHQVEDHELRPPVDARALFRSRLQSIGEPEAIGLLTSRDVASYSDFSSDCEGVSARCIATVGLGNALRAGDPPGPTACIGTINMLCHVSTGLSDEALLEALALCAEARALAVREAGIVSQRSGLPASGTGTDCIVVAAPNRDGPSARYAGKHTALGHVIGSAVMQAVQRGIRDWQRERRGVAR
jgi:adenosylcobinamide amidohydrolase